MGIKDTEIKKTVLLNTNLSKTHEDEKQGILDVRLTMNDNTEKRGSSPVKQTKKLK